MINETNYSKQTMSKVTEILGKGVRLAISKETGETFTTVNNVWYGRQYKKNIVDAIVAKYKSKLQELLLNHVS